MSNKAKDIAEALVLLLDKSAPKKEYEDSECTCKNCPMHGDESEEEEQDE